MGKEMITFLFFVLLALPAQSVAGQIQDTSNSTHMVQRHCTSCHTKEHFSQLLLGQLGWDYIILREKYFRGANIPLSERPDLSRQLAQMQPVGIGQTTIEWALLLSGVAAFLSLGAWGITYLLDSVGSRKPR
jgi:hypothetical protein